jgi:hypothetical protein
MSKTIGGNMNSYEKERKIKIQNNVQEVRSKVRKAKNCFVWCMIDGQDVGEYFKVSKTEVLNHVRKYFKNNSTNESCDFTELNSAVRLDEFEDLYIN